MGGRSSVVIEGQFIEIKGKLTKDEIVKKVVNIFIETERHQRGHRVKFRYPVEILYPGRNLYIFRPAGLNKWNFNFKVVEVIDWFGLGTHNDSIPVERWPNRPKV